MPEPRAVPAVDIHVAAQRLRRLELAAAEGARVRTWRPRGPHVRAGEILLEGADTPVGGGGFRVRCAWHLLCLEDIAGTESGFHKIAVRGVGGIIQWCMASEADMEMGLV